MDHLTIPILNKKVPPAVLAVSLLVIGAGAAAGAATGTIDGEASTEVEQALKIDDDGSDNIVIDNGGESLAQISEDRTSFVTGATIQQGEDFTIDIEIRNSADEDVTGKLVLQGTSPLHVDADGDGSQVEVQRIGKEEFLITVEDGATGDSDEVTLTVDSAQDISPGFYEFEATIKPTEVGE